MSIYTSSNVNCNSSEIIFHDRQWWRAEAQRTKTDWPSLIALRNRTIMLFRHVHDYPWLTRLSS
jgi:hypothetical protein